MAPCWSARTTPTIDGDPLYFLSVVLLLAVLPTASVILEALLSPHSAQSIEPKLTAEEIKDWDEAELSAC